MGWYDNFNAIKNAIQSTLSTVTDIQNVVFGEKEHIGQMQFPCLFIIPAEDEIVTAEATAGEGKQHNYNWELVLVGKNHDVETGLANILQLAGECYDALIADNTLGGVCLWSEIESVEPGYARAEQSMVIQWATIRLKTVIFAG